MLLLQRRLLLLLQRRLLGLLLGLPLPLLQHAELNRPLKLLLLPLCRCLPLASTAAAADMADVAVPLLLLLPLLGCLAKFHEPLILQPVAAAAASSISSSICRL
jgi:hypothetical protein